MSDLPLEGYRIIDFGWAAAAPRATCILADMGAEVIKVETRKHLDPVRFGPDNLTRDLVAAGAVGVVSVASHMAGREIAAMVDAVIDGDMYKADQLHDLLMPLNNALFSEPNPMPLKGALTAYWDSVGVPRLPLMPAKPETVEAVGAALDAINEYRSL